MRDGAALMAGRFAMPGARCTPCPLPLTAHGVVDVAITDGAVVERLR